MKEKTVQGNKPFFGQRKQEMAIPVILPLKRKPGSVFFFWFAAEALEEGIIGNHFYQRRLVILLHGGTH